MPAPPVSRLRIGLQGRFAPVEKHSEGRHRAVKIYFVARNDDTTRRRVTQGVVERDRWVMLKRELAAEGLVVTYFCSLEDDVPEDVEVVAA